MHSFGDNVERRAVEGISPSVRYWPASLLREPTADANESTTYIKKNMPSSRCSSPISGLDRYNDRKLVWMIELGSFSAGNP